MDWLAAIDRYGLPIVGVVVLCTAISIIFIWANKQFNWAKKNIITPIVNGHLKFLETTTNTQKEQSITLKTLAESQEKQTEIMGQIVCLNGRPKGD